MRNLILGLFILGVLVLLDGCSSDEVRHNPPVSLQDGVEIIEGEPMDSIKADSVDSISDIPITESIEEAPGRTKPPPSKFPPGKYIAPEIKQ